MIKAILWSLITAFTLLKGIPILIISFELQSKDVLLLIIQTAAILLLLRKLFRPIFLYLEVFFHEITHAITILTLGGRVHGFVVKTHSGAVTHTGIHRKWKQLVTSLSPYCIPTFPILTLILLWVNAYLGLYYQIFELNRTILLISFLTYLQGLYHQTHNHQSDFLTIGRYSSYCCIITCNTIWLILLIMIL